MSKNCECHCHLPAVLSFFLSIVIIVAAVYKIKLWFFLLLEFV